jgi:hypothetical protein
MTRQRVYNYPLRDDSSLIDAPTFTTMTETWDGMDQPPAVTKYTAQMTASPRRVDVMYPDGSRSAQLSHNAPGTFYDGLPYDNGLTDAANIPRREVVTFWEQGDYGSPRPRRIRRATNSAR